MTALDNCRRCGGEGYVETDAEDYSCQLLCPTCHGSGERPAALAPKTDPVPTVRFLGVELDARTFRLESGLR